MPVNAFRNKVRQAWAHMISRCHDPKAADYPRYGGRGVRVCKNWHAFEPFYAYVGDPPSLELTLGRIDTKLGYCPGNVRWETWEQQNRNRRDTRYITWRGKTQGLMDWSEELQMPYKTLSKRLYELGWGKDRAFLTPVPAPTRARRFAQPV